MSPTSLRLGVELCKKLEQNVLKKLTCLKTEMVNKNGFEQVIYLDGVGVLEEDDLHGVVRSFAILYDIRSGPM